MGFGLGYVAQVSSNLAWVLLTHHSVAWVSVGTYYATNLTLQWRLPLALATVGPLGLLIGLPFVPGEL